MGRFTLLHDRNILMRDLAKERHSSFLDLDITFSAGLKRLISDVNDATRDNPALDSATNAALKSYNVYELITRHLNTEKFLDAEVGLGFPLPAFSLSGLKFLSNPFYALGAGTSFSFSNNEDYLTPKAQLYLRKEEKIGLRLLTLIDTKERLTLNLYQMKRSDLDISMTSTDIATKGSLFTLGDLKKNETSLSSDLIWEKEDKYSLIHLEASELKLMNLSSKTTGKSRYGTKPFFKAEYERKNVIPEKHFSPFFGMHYRSRYSLDDGLFMGFHMIPFDRLPFSLTMAFDNQFFVFMPMLKTKWFEFIYSWRNPHQNPQDEIWVSSQHTLVMNFPFP